MILLALIPIGLIAVWVAKKRRHKARVKATTWGMSEALDIAEAVAPREPWNPKPHRRYGWWV